MTAAYRRYERYKDSGVEWIGEVPEHWSIKKLSWVFNMIGSGTTPNSTNEEYYDGDIPWINTGDLNDGYLIEVPKTITRLALKEFSALKIYEPNTLLIAMYGATIGKLAITKIEATTNQACCALSKPINLEVKYIFYWFMANRNHIIAMGYGGGQPNISQNLIKSLKVTLPTQHEQKNIVKFLDQKTSEIDSLIADKEKLIELLQEQRQAIISEAVTKGLDKNAKMKDSGTPWIGEVPEGWEIKRIKHIAFLKSGEGITSELINEEDKYPVYGGNGLRGYTASFTHNGDYILIGRQGALCGNINYAHGKFWASEHAVVVMPIVTLETLWLGELLRIMNLNQYSISAAQPGLAVDKIKNLFLPFPPYQEQKAIANYIGQKISDIDYLIKQIKAQITHLFEYRQSLISEAVTGKIMV